MALCWVVVLLAGCSLRPLDGYSREWDAGGAGGAGGGSGPLMLIDGGLDLRGVLTAMPPDTWLRVNIGLRSACDDDTISPWHQEQGCAGIVSAWSGAVFAPDQDAMLVFGGGNAAYAGNEVYAFSLAQGRWTRLTEPSPPPYSTDPLAAGQPVARATYGGLAYLPDAQRMLAWGGARATDGNATGVTWLFDPAARTWTAPVVASPPAGVLEQALVYEPASKRVFLKTIDDLYAFDFGQSSWTLVRDLTNPPFWPRYRAAPPSGAVDTRRGIVWFIGGSLYLAYDVAADAFVTDQWITTGGATFDNDAEVSGHPGQRIITGGNEVLTAAGPGLAYDRKADQLVAWVGGGPWALDLGTREWKRRNATGAPTAQQQAGTYGRFRYIEAYNVFVLVNSIDEVFFYKNLGGGS